MNNTFKEQLKCITTWGQEIYIGLLLKINTTNLLFRDFTQQRSLSILLIVVFLFSSGKTRRNRGKKNLSRAVGVKEQKLFHRRSRMSFSQRLTAVLVYSVHALGGK